MEDTIKTKAVELANALMESSEYQRYKELLDIVRQDQELYGRINEYRRGNMNLMAMSPEEWLIAGEKLIARYKDVFDNDIAREFLATEDDMCNRLAWIKDYLYNTINLDLEFLD